MKKIEKLIIEQSDTIGKITAIEEQLSKKKYNTDNVNDDEDDSFVWEDTFPLTTDEDMTNLESNISSRAAKRKLVIK